MILTPARGALLILVAMLLAAGCAKLGRSGGEVAGIHQIRVTPIPSPDRILVNQPLFYVEYLLESETNTTRVGVLAEPLKSPLTFILNPARYASGQTGAEKIGDLIKRFAPLRFYSLRNAAGKHLGYALLRPRETLRTLSAVKGRYRLELSPKK